MMPRCGLVWLILMSEHYLTQANFTVGSLTTKPHSTTASSLSSPQITTSIFTTVTSKESPRNINSNVTKFLRSIHPTKTLQPRPLLYGNDLSSPKPYFTPDVSTPTAPDLAHYLTQANFTVGSSLTTTPHSTTTSSLSSPQTTTNKVSTVTSKEKPGDINSNVTKFLRSINPTKTLQSEPVAGNDLSSTNPYFTQDVSTTTVPHSAHYLTQANFTVQVGSSLTTTPHSTTTSSLSSSQPTQNIPITVTSKEEPGDINLNATKILGNNPMSTVQSEYLLGSYLAANVPSSQNDESSKLDSILIKTIFKQSNRKTKDPISDLLVALCGYQISCYDRKHGILQTNGIACCDFCSCDVTSCHISNNCCPNIEPMFVASELDPTPTCKLQHNIFTNIIKSQQQTASGNHSEKISNSNVNNPSNSTSTNFNDDCTNLSKNDEPCIGNDSTAQPTNPATHNLKDITALFPDFANVKAEYLVISTCPVNHSDAYTVEQCTREDSNYLVHYLPISDWIKSHTYRNIYCAECNNATTTWPWMVQTDCPRLYTEIFPSRVDHLADMTRDCTVNLVSKRFLNIPTCHTDDAQNVIKSCNVTGKWQEYNKYIEDMCVRNASVSIYNNSENQPNAIYRNAFCYLCNIDKSDEHQHKCSKKSGPDQSTDSSNAPAFHAMIDVTIPIFCGYSPDKMFCAKDTTDTVSKCPYHSFTDSYTNACRQLVCPVSSTAMKIMCIEKQPDVAGLTVTGRLLFTTKYQYICGAPHTPACNQRFFQTVHQDFDKALSISSYHCIPAVVKILYNTSNDGLRKFYAIYKITNTHKCSVNKVLSIFTKLQEKPVLINKDIQIYSQMIFDSIDEDTFKYNISITNKTVHEDVLLNSSFNSPRVVLTLKEYHQYVKNSYINPVEKNILEQQYTLDTGNIEISLQHFMQNYLQNKIVQTKTAANPIAIQLSIISSLISIASILFVLITYGIFSDLRFLPGKLLMTLCVNLLLAQLLYLFGMNLGIDNIWCKLIGACIHVFWLATIFSMNCCLRLMVQNFNSPLQEDNRMLMQSKSNSQVLKSFLFCYCIPIICVLANVITSSLQTPPSCGYGGELCYITTPTMRMYTFAVPLGIVVLINFCMFAVIMMKICKVMHNYNTICMKQIVIFCKLSTITGMYWGFGFLYEATAIPMFSYLFIVFNAGQGFFLMWSFLFNTRVLEMYKQLFRRYLRKINTEWTFTAMIRELEAVRGRKHASLQNQQFTSSV